MKLCTQFLVCWLSSTGATTTPQPRPYNHGSATRTFLQSRRPTVQPRRACCRLADQSCWSPSSFWAGDRVSVRQMVLGAYTSIFFVPLVAEVTISKLIDTCNQRALPFSRGLKSNTSVNIVWLALADLIVSSYRDCCLSYTRRSEFVILRGLVFVFYTRRLCRISIRTYVVQRLLLLSEHCCFVASEHWSVVTAEGFVATYQCSVVIKHCSAAREECVVVT